MHSPPTHILRRAERPAKGSHWEPRALPSSENANTRGITITNTAAAGIPVKISALFRPSTNSANANHRAALFASSHISAPPGGE